MKQNKLVAIDTETSGLCPRSNALLQVAMVPINFDANPISINVAPESIKWQPTAKKMFEPQEAEWMASVVDYAAGLSLIEGWLAAAGSCILVGHNVGFDVSFLKQLSATGGLPRGLHHRSIDTYTLAHAAFAHAGADMPDGLTALLDHFCIFVPGHDRHTAIGDALATAALYKELMKMLVKE